VVLIDRGHVANSIVHQHVAIGRENFFRTEFGAQGFSFPTTMGAAGTLAAALLLLSCHLSLRMY
jgi:hypothetical protein